MRKVKKVVALNHIEAGWSFNYVEIFRGGDWEADIHYVGSFPHPDHSALMPILKRLFEEKELKLQGITA
ncbi:hypothetical protein LJC74_08460 [Eubacteriales bacterium OttesenSCG-928-A19]|nr:hypothetical protein [Eubacteriales bacterium OttesenSCG-928-A19]